MIATGAMGPGLPADRHPGAGYAGPRGDHELPLGAVSLRAATSADVGAMGALINGYAARDLLRWRSEASLRDHLSEFVVAVERPLGRGAIVGCGALTVLGPGLGEVRSLAVRGSAAGRGVGRLIVSGLLDRARAGGLRRVLALTGRPRFFAALGFAVTRRARFPEKLAADCARCLRNAFCDEVAMVADVAAPDA